MQDVEEVYLKAREQIQILKKNHVFVKNNFKGPS
jgi:hypothetical protein